MQNEPRHFGNNNAFQFLNGTEENNSTWENLGSEWI